MSCRRTATVILVCVALGLAACGSVPAPSVHRSTVVPFDVHRRLATADARALAALSSPTAERPTIVTMGDGMVSERAHPISFADSQTKGRFDAQLQIARSAARRYVDARSARADGYVLASYFVPEFGVHWVKWSLVDRPFDPAHPAMLLFDGEGIDAHLVALSYYVRSVDPPAGFAGENDQWHRHFGDCYAGGFVVGEEVGSADVCTKIGEARAAGVIRAPVGTPAEAPEIQRYLVNHQQAAGRPSFASDLVAGNDLWMLHVWVGAGRPNSWGTFATANPALTRCTGSCRSAAR